MTHREASKKIWGCGDTPVEEQINMGSLQRIADATELMAKNYSQLLRQNASLRGVITKLKKKSGAA